VARAVSSVLVLGLLAGYVQACVATEEGFFDSDGVKIRYTLDGPAAGEPVLLIHGYSASGTLNWRLPGMIRALEDEYRVITIDNRGHGGSDKLLSPKDYGAKMAEDAVRLLDHLQIDKAHVVGYSMGGMITLKLLAEHPERIRSAVVGGMGWGEKPSDPGWLTALMAEADAPTAMAACRRAFPGLGITRDQLAGIQVPFSVVIGGEDGLRERVDKLQQVRQDVPVVIVPGANHTNCVMRAEFRTAIREFLDAHRTAAVGQ